MMHRRWLLQAAMVLPAAALPRKKIAAIVTEYRIHDSLEKDAPDRRPVQHKP